MSTHFQLTVFSEPTTFATRRERQWKNAIVEAATKVTVPSDITGIEMVFRVSSKTRNGHPYDLDNLCEPIFSALTKSNWFGGKKTNIKWWKATKEVAVPAGVIITGDSHPCIPDWSIVLLQKYKGVLPISGKDEVFISWVQSVSERFDISTISGSIGVILRFGSDEIHIADIATGRVKNIIDCLFPMIGGQAGAPDDWKIDGLFVEKGVAELSVEELELTICSLR